MSLSEPSFSEYGVSFQEKVVQALLTDHKWSEQMFEILKMEYFDLKYLSFLVERYFKYYQKYKNFPTMNILITIIRDDLREGSEQILRDKIIEFLTKLKTNPEVGDLDFVKEKSLDFCRNQAMKEALEKALDDIVENNGNNVLNLIKSAMNVGTSPDVGHNFLDDIDSRYIKSVRHPIPTGVPELDRILNGGLGRGELGVVIAPTGVGKSHWLVQVAAHALSVGKDVLHYTFELTENVVGLRFDSYLCDIDSNDLLGNIDNKERVKKIYESMELGRLYIKEYPTDTATVQTLRSHMERLLLRNFNPGLIVVDYADVMRASRKFDSLRHELSLIYKELRNLASEKNIPIWTASQSNRIAAQNDIVGLENMSEAYGKAMVADVVISISRKAQEKADGSGRMFVAKNRAGVDGLVFPIFIDTAKSKISVVSDESQTLQEYEQSKEKSNKSLFLEKWKEVNNEKMERGT